LRAHRHQRPWFALAVLFTLDIAALAAQTPARESDREFDRGLQLQRKGDLEGAKRSYEAALKLSPGRIDALSNVGLVYAGLRQYNRAVRSFEKALTIAPGQPAVVFNLGLTYLQAGQNENAWRTLTSLVETQNDNFMARHYLGVSLLKLGRIQEGMSELEAVASAHPEDLDAAYTLGSAYIARQQLEKARQLIETAISRHDTAESHLIAGSYYLAAQNYRQAVLELRRAQELNPALPELGRSLGGAYAMTGSQEMAVQLFQANLQKNPDDFDTLAFLGWLYLEAERLDDAEKALNKAHEIRPLDLEVMFQLARIARGRGQFEQAAELLRHVIAAKPDHVRAHVLLAQTYFRLKKIAEGQKEREIVRRLNDEEQVKHLKETGIDPGAQARQ
jgi:tetratricopeptide (TPR) repeat protein